MTSRRDFLAATLAGFAGGLAVGRAAWADTTPPTPPEVTTAAARLLAALSGDQRAKVMLPAADVERFNWHFVPLNDAKTRASTRKGVCLDDMPAAGRAAALDMLKAATSPDGFKWCQDIMAREAVLAELEPTNAWFRKPGWYFVTVYGTPAATGNWGWRLDGHHLSVSVAVADGAVVSASPCFMGVNPVTLKHGPRKGERDTITPAEDLGRDLFLALDAGQRKAALLPAHLPEVAGRTAKAPATLPTGLPAAGMTAKQQDALVALIGHYTGRMPAALAKRETDGVLNAGLAGVSFAYSGEAEAGKRHTYNVQGPTFLIHYMNEMTDPQKTPANHIHSVYRSRAGDFGGAAA